MSCFISVLALLAVASVSASGTVTVPCGSDGAYPTFGAQSPLGTEYSVTGDASGKCFVKGIEWKIPEATSEVALRDVRVEGVVIQIGLLPRYVELLLEGVVIKTGRLFAISISTEANLTIRNSVVERSGPMLERSGKVMASYRTAYVISVGGFNIKRSPVHIVNSTITLVVSGDICSNMFAVSNRNSNATVVIDRSSIEVRAEECESADAVGVDAGSLMMKTSKVSVMAPTIAKGVVTSTFGNPTAGWIVVEDSSVTASGTAAGATVLGIAGAGIQLAGSSIMVNGTGGTVTAALVYNTASARPVTIEASMMSASASAGGGDVAGLHWRGDLTTRLDLRAGTKLTGPIVVEGDVTGDIIMNGASVTAEAGPVIDVQGTVNGSLKLGVTAAVSLVTPGLVPVNAAGFAEECSVTFGASSFEGREPLVALMARVCKVTKVPGPTKYSDEPASSAAALPFSMKLVVVLVASAAGVFA